MKSSALDYHEDCSDIFDGYDDYWYFPKDRMFFIANEMNLSLMNEVKRLEKSGERVFAGKYNLNKLRCDVIIQQIKYNPRVILIDNDFYYKNKNLIGDLLSGISFIKPENFKKEKEMRFLFDFYDENKNLLHPLKKFIIIKSTETLDLLSRRK